MPIEFRCIQCQKPLRVSDDALGKKARCPQCGTIQDPVSAEAPAVSFPPAVPPAPANWSDRSASSGAAPQNPFADSASTDNQNPFAEATHNPYEAPQSGYSPAIHTRQTAFAKVQTPAVLLLALASIAGTMQVFSISFMIVQMVARNGWINDFSFASNAIGLGMSVTIGYGAWHMRKLKNYGLALTAAILAAVPCSPCCLFTVPIGIWALIVLVDPHVKGEFH
jgi:hypothetical protein